MVIDEVTIKKLSQPMSANAIKWKIQTKPNQKGNALVVAYIDARDVAERLDEVFPGAWSSSFRMSPTGDSLECTITINSESRSDAGFGDNDKERYSDALKRAAVQWGVGRFLYRFPTVYAKTEPIGRSFKITDAAKENLLSLNAVLIKGDKPARFNSIWVINEPTHEENAESQFVAQPEPEKSGHPETSQYSDTEDEHPWYATSASLSDKLKDSILRLAEGDLDRAVEVLELHMIRKEAGLDPIWTQTIAVASLDHAVELELPQAMVKLTEVIGDDLASAFDYYVLCLRAGYTIDLANANLARCGNDIAAAMTAAQRDNGKAA
jgi:hypothetical protein